MHITVIQMNSQDNLDENLRTVERLVKSAHSSHPSRMYILPEYTPFAGGNIEDKRNASGPVPGGRIAGFMSDLAASLQVGIFCGSLNEIDGGRLFNTAVMFDPLGHIIAKYRKMYLFSATLPDGRHIDEGSLYVSGNSAVSFEFEGVRFGCAICYDLRFPELFRFLRRQNVDAFIFAAAMPKVHGDAHAELLLRVRAIETQSYVLASHQCGTTMNGTRQSSGGSMIVDPWGTVRARLHNEVGYISSEIDLNLLKEVRARVPILSAADKVLAAGAYKYKEEAANF